MGNYKDGNLLALIRTDSEAVEWLNNGVVAAQSFSPTIYLDKGESGIDILIKSPNQVNQINFSGSFDNNFFFWLEPENGDINALPQYSRPIEYESTITPIDNSGTIEYYYTWKFRNIPPYIKFYNPMLNQQSAIYASYKTYK